jgi:hypothetical protein
VILTDFLKLGGEPTLWIWIGSALDYRDLCSLISLLAEGEINSVKSSSLPKLFKHLPGMSEFILASAMPGEMDGNIIVISRNGQIIWKLSHEDWRSTLQWLSALPPYRHNFIEYPEATVKFLIWNASEARGVGFDISKTG